MSIRERVEIFIRARGARKTGQQIGNIGDYARRATIQAHRLKSALAGIAAAFGIVKLARMVDGYTNLQNRLRVVTEGKHQLAVVTRELYKVANNNRTSIDTTSILYQRMAVTLRDLGKSAFEGFEIIDTLSKGITISGATTAEARGAMIQFSQALSGDFKTASQEMNSLLEQTPIIVDAIALEIDRSRSEVKDYAKEGKLSSAIVIRALEKIRGSWLELYARTVPTMDSAFQVLKNKFQEFTGAVDKFFGVSRNLALTILDLGDNIEVLAKSAAVAAITIATILTPAMSKLAFSYTVVLALRRPFATITAAILAAGVAAVAFGDKIKVSKDSLATVRDVALVVWSDIRAGLGRLWQATIKIFPSIGQVWKSMTGGMKTDFRSVVTVVAGGLQNIVNIVRAAVRTAIQTWQYFPRALLEVTLEALSKAWDAIYDFGVRVGEYLKDVVIGVLTLDFERIIGGKIDPWVESASGHIGDVFMKKFEEETRSNTSITDYVEELWGRADARAADAALKAKAELEKMKKAEDELKEAGKRKIKSRDGKDKKRGPKTFATYLTELQREQELGIAVGHAYEVLNTQLQIANKLRRDLTEAEKGKIEAQVLANESLALQRSLLEEIRGPHEEFRLGTEALGTLFQDGKISLDEYNTAMTRLRENFVNGLPEAATFAEGFGQQMAKMQTASANGMAQIGTQVAQIFGPGGTLINGIGDAVAQSLVFGKSFKEQIRGIAQSIISQLISSLVKVGLNMVLNATLGQTLMAGQTAAGVAQAGALAAAYTPAAAMSSLATGGANAAGAATGISSIMGILASLAGSIFGGFETGGYTGAVGRKDVAGVVHGQEFVINAAATKRHRSLLEAINMGKDPDMALQSVGPSAAPVSISVVNEIPDAAFEARALSETEIEIIAKRVVRQEAPETVANDLRNPNSRTSKAISNNTTASRKRG